MVKKILFRLFYVSFLTNLIFTADNIAINIESSKEEVAANEWFQINITLSGEASNAQLKDVANLDSSVTLKKSGVMSSVNIINGVMTSSLTYSFACNISKTGTFEIGPFVFSVKGKEYSSKTIKINVNGSTENENNDNNEKNEVKDQTDYYIFEAMASKKEAYQDEFIDIGINFYNKAEIGRYIYKPLSSFPTGSWVERFDTDDSCTTKFIKNSNYNEKNFERVRLFISRPGTYTIDPAAIKFEGFSSGDNFFSNIEVMTLKTKPVTIKINPLPDNPPKNFRDAVGFFKYDSKINKNEVSIKEPISLSITLRGEGNFQNIKDFTYNIADSFEVYPSKVNISSDKNKTTKIKTQEIVFVPKNQGNYKLKLDDFSYFDINQKKYVTLSGNQFKIRVLKAPESTNNNKNKEEYNEKTNENDSNLTHEKNKKDFSNKNDSPDDTDTLSAIKQIRLNIGTKINPGVYDFWFKFIIIFYLLIILFIAVFIFTRLTIATDSAVFFKFNAYRKFSRQLNSLEKKPDKISFQHGIDIISNSIEKYFISKFRIDSIEFTRKGIHEKLENHISLEDISILESIITKINMARFSGANISKLEYNELLKQVKNFIKKIEIKFKK